MPPRPILKSLPAPDLTFTSGSPFPFSSSAGLLDSPHVHFPPTPTLTSTGTTHSPFIYDRAPIDISPNTCALPERGERDYSHQPPPSEPHFGRLGWSSSHHHRSKSCSRERDGSGGRGVGGVDYFDPRASRSTTTATTTSSYEPLQAPFRLSSSQGKRGGSPLPRTPLSASFVDDQHQYYHHANAGPSNSNSGHFRSSSRSSSSSSLSYPPHNDTVSLAVSIMTSEEPPSSSWKYSSPSTSDTMLPSSSCSKDGSRHHSNVRKSKSRCRVEAGRTFRTSTTTITGDIHDTGVDDCLGGF